MKIIRTVSILAILCMSGFNCESNYTELESNSSCVPAEPLVNASTRNAACIFFNYTDKDGICRNSISSLYVFGNSAKLQFGETQIGKAGSVKISEQCEPIMIDLYCRHYFPPCDMSLARPHARRICRTSCEYMIYGLCEKDLEVIREAIAKVPGLLDETVLNCALYSDTANGGDVPECYQYHTVPGDDTKSTDCYYGVGVGYRGNVNITRSGLTCQTWRSQCPHRHWRIPEDVTDEQNDSNACRNPDSSAPDGPWCYTADPNVRWEYCNVTRCPPRVPEEVPSSLRGFPLNSTAIYISWRRLPPSRYKEQLLGYRVKYRRLTSRTYKEINITSNFTETVLTGLVAQSEYEIQVSGFNEIGHGPASKVFVVKTVSAGEVAVDLNIQLVIDTEFDNDLLNRSSNKFMDMEEKITTAIMRHFDKSSVLKVFDIRVLRFSMGSVEADLEILVVINSNTTREDEALNHLVEGLSSGILGLSIFAVRVQENPQPPNDLRVTVVQTRYMVLKWNQPKYGNFYGIQNYSIEQKTEPSGNFIAIHTIPYSRTGMTIEDLEPSTEYSIRVSSNNKYGRSDGVMITQRTLPDNFIRDLMLIIVLPLILAVLFIVVVCIKVRPCSKPKPETSKPQFSMQVMGGDWLEFSPSDVKLQDKLGEGAFGEAYKGLVRVDKQWYECAVKKLKVNPTERETRDLINELQIMVTVGEHPNVISLIGACTRSGPILVVVRLAENGCLLTYLKKKRKNPYLNVKSDDLPQIDKLSIARDVANGMLHLATKRCVHRDLAARNVLLGKNNIAMVSDFGMSRDVYESGEYENTTGGMLPIRWMALESLEDYTYNTKTDVWSFGVVLWEIQSGGKTPYSGLGGMELIDFLTSGQRLTQPDGCPDEIYETMISCWHPDPSKRPSFSDLVTYLERELLNKGDYPKENGPETESQGNVNYSAEVDRYEDLTTSF